MATSNNSLVDMLKAGLLGGLGWGVAITMVHLAQGIGLIVALGTPPMTGFAAMTVPMEVTLGVLAGLLFSPATRLPRGEWVHPLLLALAWIGMERWVAVDPSKILMWIGPTLGALVVFSIGRALWRRSKPAVAALALAIPAITLVIPEAIEASKPPLPMREGAATAPAGAPDVLFIVMDTVRAQSSSAYGYERKTTPNFDRLAAEGVRFADANSPATWSLPAHAALFTGTFPSWNNANAETRFLDDKLPTLAETLADAGWQTRCFSANPHISDSFGLTRGFQANDKAWATGTSARNFSFIYRLVDALHLGGAEDKGGSIVVGNIERWMDSRPADSPPQFVFVNFLEAHFPFHQLPDEFLFEFQDRPVSELREINQIAFGVQFGRQLTEDEFQTVHQPLVDMYDAGVLYTDHLVGEVIDIWREAGRLDNTVVIVLGDHGESVGEHGAFGHVTPMNEQVLRVPFAIRYPSRIPAGSVVDQPITTVGTYATVLDLLELDPPGVYQVGSLLPGLQGEDVGKPILAERFEEHMLSARFAEGEANGEGPLVNPRGRFRAYRSGPYKLVQHTTDGTVLFNLDKDPAESKDIAGQDKYTTQGLVDEMGEWQRKLGLPELDAPIDAPKLMPENLSAEELEALRALGYIE